MSGPKFYHHPQRKGGNQAEHPAVGAKGDVIQFRGYQKFDLQADGTPVPVEGNLSRKAGILGEYLGRYPKETFMDLGCSNAFFCFMALKKGFKRAFAVDHDVGYLNNIDRGRRGLPVEPVHTKVDEHFSQRADVLIAMALIHWIYSCTSCFGSLDKILGFFASLVNDYAIIEWVDPTDGAIKMFGHLKHNREFTSEAYTKDNFLAGLRKHFAAYKKIGNTNNEREIYIAWKRIPFDAFCREMGVVERPLVDTEFTGGDEKDKPGTSRILYDVGKQRVLKVYREDLIFKCFEREVFWLKTLESTGLVPRLLSIDRKRQALEMTWTGEEVTRENLPENWKEQVQELCKVLEGYACRHNDIKPGELLVKDGKLSLCDWGWGSKGFGGKDLYRYLELTRECDLYLTDHILTADADCDVLLKLFS